jgi:hypothetical protein
MNLNDFMLQEKEISAKIKTHFSIDPLVDCQLQQIKKDGSINYLIELENSKLGVPYIKTSGKVYFRKVYNTFRKGTLKGTMKKEFSASDVILLKDLANVLKSLKTLDKASVKVITDYKVRTVDLSNFKLDF